MIRINKKEECCGCGACFNKCPKRCITMNSDEEGFRYPVTDQAECNECGLCEKVCPCINYKEEIPRKQMAYLVQNRDESIRSESTAGGAFSAIASYVIKKGGIVYGVSYDLEFHVCHTKTDKIEELGKFRNSKYVQSNTGVTFAEVKKYLDQERMVCFSGTPCQIEGLKSFLQKDYDKLVTVDVVCHAVPSPLVWQKYLEMQFDKYGEGISNIMFRDKHYGYKYSTMTIKGDNGKKVYAYGIDTDPMLRAFFSNICDRPSCYACMFKKRYRQSDFTIWDCFPVGEFDKSLDDDKGTTRVLIHTEKGMRLFDEIKNNFRYIFTTPEKLTDGVKEMFQSVGCNEKRNDFFIDANVLSGDELFNKYFPETVKVKLERSIRVFCYKTGIYNFAKRTAKKILNKR